MLCVCVRVCVCVCVCVCACVELKNHGHIKGLTAKHQQQQYLENITTYIMSGWLLK